MYNIPKFINKIIIIVQIPKGKLTYANRKIIEKKNEFFHLVENRTGTSGCPIFLKNTTTVIGMLKCNNIYYEENLGDFIGPIYDFFKNFS